ncbi:ribosome silencing factor [Pararhizobium mangrovi]|uniref:Ribosomal silencing factor RsfS n=1 Tax=Pararhizobium mangrovi TaxID=2590452 RepID=A0A506TYY0_9HYPH|nr:ribosome silencing factor [Pararhizobium mangrovi]TPW26526.1 ribosome silencing factor [Pararhizobium mangrovi]
MLERIASSFDEPVRFVRPREGKTLRTAHKGDAKSVFSTAPESGTEIADRALRIVLDSLDEAKAEDVVSIDISGKSALGDHMIVATGRSNRHVMAVCNQLLGALKEQGFGSARVEGLDHGEWVLIDAGDVIVHVFQPEIRDFYNLEKMWMIPDLADDTVH